MGNKTRNKVFLATMAGAVIVSAGGFTPTQVMGAEKESIPTVQANAEEQSIVKVKDFTKQTSVTGNKAITLNLEDFYKSDKGFTLKSVIYNEESKTIKGVSNNGNVVKVDLHLGGKGTETVKFVLTDGENDVVTDEVSFEVQNEVISISDVPIGAEMSTDNFLFGSFYKLSKDNKFLVTKASTTSTYDYIQTKVLNDFVKNVFKGSQTHSTGNLNWIFPRSSNWDNLDHNASFGELLKYIEKHEQTYAYYKIDEETKLDNATTIYSDSTILGTVKVEEYFTLMTPSDVYKAVNSGTSMLKTLLNNRNGYYFGTDKNGNYTVKGIPTSELNKLKFYEEDNTFIHKPGETTLIKSNSFRSTNDTTNMASYQMKFKEDTQVYMVSGGTYPRYKVVDVEPTEEDKEKYKPTLTSNVVGLTTIKDITYSNNGNTVLPTYVTYNEAQFKQMKDKEFGASTSTVINANNYFNYFTTYVNEKDIEKEVKFKYEIVADTKGKNPIDIYVNEKNGNFYINADKDGSGVLYIWIEDTYGVSEKVAFRYNTYKTVSENLTTTFKYATTESKQFHVEVGGEQIINLDELFAGYAKEYTFEVSGTGNSTVYMPTANTLSVNPEKYGTTFVKIMPKTHYYSAFSTQSAITLTFTSAKDNAGLNPNAIQVKDLDIQNKRMQKGTNVGIDLSNYFDFSGKSNFEPIVEVEDSGVVSTKVTNNVLNIDAKKDGTTNIKVTYKNEYGVSKTKSFDVTVYEEVVPLVDAYEVFDMTLQIPNEESDYNDIILSGLFNKLKDKSDIKYTITDTVKKESIDYKFDEETQILSVLGKNKGFSSIQIVASDSKGNVATAVVLVDAVKDLNYTLNGIKNGVIYAGAETYNVPLNEVFGAVNSKVKYSVEVTKVTENTLDSKTVNSYSMYPIKAMSEITPTIVGDIPNGVPYEVLFNQDGLKIELINGLMVIDGADSGNYEIVVKAETEDGKTLNPVMFKLDVKAEETSPTEPTEPTPTEPTEPPSEGTEPTPTEPTEPPTEGGDNDGEGTEPTPTEPTEPPSEGGGNDGEGTEPTPTEPTEPPSEGGGNDGEGTEPTPTEPTEPPSEGGGNDGEGTEPTPSEPTNPPSEGGGNDGEGKEPTPTEPINPPSDNEGDKDGEGTEPTPSEPTNPPSDNEGDKDGEGTEPTPSDNEGKDEEGTKPSEPTEDDLIVDEGTIGKPIDDTNDKPIITEDVDTPTKDTVNVDKNGTTIDENINDIVDTDGNDGEPNKVEPTKDNGEDIPKTNTESNKGLLGGGIALLLSLLTFGLYNRKKKVAE